MVSETLAADAVRAHDRQGRRAAARCSPTPPGRRIKNGGFEEILRARSPPAGWHYQRQMELVAASRAPRASVT